MSVATVQLSSIKGSIQESQYSFPYHYLPNVYSGTKFNRHRGMVWGFEYMCYLLHAREVVNQLEPSSVLEVGCGDGRFSGMLEKSNRRIVGVDISERAIGFARAFNPSVEFHAVDAGQLDEQFGLVAAIEVLEHISDNDVPAFLNVLADRTEEGGHVMISVPSVNVPVSPKHYRHYDEALIRQQIADAGVALEIEEIQYVFREPSWLWCLQRAMSNPIWSLYVNKLETLLWNRVWRKYRIASKSTACHLLIIARKKATAV